MHACLVLAVIVATTPAVAPNPFPLQTPVAGAQVSAEKPWPPPGVVKAGSGVTSPRLIREVKPSYPAAAKSARIKGIVSMEVVILPDGKVGDVRVVHSLDKTYGLDDEAVKTVKKWLFSPGKKDGIAVPVLVEIEMTFSLR